MKFIKLEDINETTRLNQNSWAPFFSKGQRVAQKMMELKWASERDYR